MARKQIKLSNDQPQLEMTPMIDVVFQLLIFFIVTLKQEDILSKLTANRPAPDPNSRPESQPDLINITIHKGGFVFKGRPVDRDQLDRQIERIASLDPKASVLMRCTADSPHRFLVQALDICNKYKMQNLSVFSM